MELNEAAAMLKNGISFSKEKMQWADLGCGSGTFTLALAGLLPPESLIHAMDTGNASLAHIPNSYNDVSIKKWQTDFVTSIMPFEMLDGVLMANSLHYVKDKPAFIETIAKNMKNEGRFIIVEYDNDRPVKNWVPYPVSFLSLKKLFENVGYTSVQKLHERPSVYGSTMYSALILK